MSLPGVALGQTYSASPLRRAFLKWQCHVRQIAMRQNEGRPDAGMTPEVFLPGKTKPMGTIITLLNKAPGHSVTPELKHMFKKTNDPAQRREQAIRYLSATHYQKAAEFSDILTATFVPGSEGARRMRDAGTLRLRFAAYAQVFDLTCRVWKLVPRNPLYQATMAHNRLFNPALPHDTVVLGFEPDWATSKTEPEFR